MPRPRPEAPRQEAALTVRLAKPAPGKRPLLARIMDATRVLPGLVRILLVVRCELECERE
jgi:hypothetical protein